MPATFDFQAYVDTRKQPGKSRLQGGFGDYAYSGDIRVLRTMAKVAPVRISVEAAIRAFKAWYRADLLGSSVRVNGRQFPRLNDIVAECARELHIPMPSVYVNQNNARINAGTFGTEGDAFILVPSITIDAFDDAELRFVVGHECAHIQNNHVTYGTALTLLTNMAGSFVAGVATPATLALKAWSRRAEITCDRAGLVCSRDLKAAVSALVKTAGGTTLAKSIDIDEYLSQLEDIKGGFGRLAELDNSHPYLPKRVKALTLFAESSYYRRLIGEEGGRPLTDVDKEVDEVVRVW